MLPFNTGTVIIGEYLENWNDVKSGTTYVVVSKSEGIVYKRAMYKFKQEKGLKLSSDNKAYESFWLETDDILEIWKAKAYISTDFPEVSLEPSLESLTTMISDMQKTILNLKERDI